MATNYELVAAPTPAANTAAVLTFPALPGGRHVLVEIFAGFRTTPSGSPTLIVEDGAGNVVRNYAIGAAPQTFDFGDGIIFSRGRACVLTLSAGGAGVVGVLSAKHAMA